MPEAMEVAVDWGEQGAAAEAVAAVAALAVVEGTAAEEEAEA